MRKVENPSRQDWKRLCERPQFDITYLTESVKSILNQVRDEGDKALLELTKQFDHVSLTSLLVSNDEVDTAETLLDAGLKTAIQTARDNIKCFHAAQRRDIKSIETTPGVVCWRKAVPIDKVGIYIPGGLAPLFSTVLMLGIPAQLAGCREVILCTPPDKKGNIHPAILYAAKLVGITKIYKIGGAQAIAAMAYGTETISQTYKIFGPGNQYVTKAKQLVSEEGVAIDMPAGPSEVLVMVDENANAEFVAADLLSQAEHGPDSQVMLVVNPSVDISTIKNELSRQLAMLPRKQIAEAALKNSYTISFLSTDDAIDFINEYAPEHLIINRTDADALAEKIINAGSVFLGSYTPESAGDYASGTNHTLPTNGYAKAYAGVSLESFTKYITFQRISKEGIRVLGPVIEKMAEAESLMGHKQAVTIRLNHITSNKA